MRVRLIQVPYHLGRENIGVANGPVRLAAAGPEKILETDGFDVDTIVVERESPFEDEMAAVDEINSAVAAAVTAAHKEERFPLLFSGNCNASLGAIAALDPGNTGIVWFDAHGDFNTPDTSPSGFFDGMPLAVATGRCYKDHWKTIGARTVVPDTHILLAGIRDVDTAEQANIDGSDVLAVPAAKILEHGVDDGFLPKLAELRSRVSNVYLHLDIDAMDPADVPGIEYKTSGGLSGEQMCEAIHAVGECFTIRGAAIASFSPDYDENNRTLELCLKLVREIVLAARNTS